MRVAQKASSLIEISCRALNKHQAAKHIAWADSTVTLDWIKVENVKQKLFAGNQVNEIKKFDNFLWGHIPTQHNTFQHSDSAEIGNRGMCL